jgi:hypothetical protein
VAIQNSPPSGLPRSLEQFSGPLGSLSLSLVGVQSDSVALRSYHWHRTLWSLGIELPLFVVHDFGWALAAPTHAVELSLPRFIADEKVPSDAFKAALEDYKRLLDEFVNGHVCQSCRRLTLGDDALVGVLARLLCDVARRAGRHAPKQGPPPIDANLLTHALRSRVQLFRGQNRNFELQTLAALQATRPYLLILLDTLDLGTLELLGLLGQGGSSQSPEIVDLLSTLGSPESANIADFALEVLPSVLETKHRRQASTYAAHGYAGLTRRGNIDSLVLTELAWDEPELVRRLLDHEVLYFAREEAQQDERRLHWLLVDASASMRGERATFARGMALATAKKLVLEGEEVWLSFFDARLYEKHVCRPGKLPLTHVLSFRGERGRNPARVFSELCVALELQQKRSPRQLVVELFTHAALSVPRRQVENVGRLCQLSCVFVLPSRGKLDLDYLDLLHTHWVVDEAALVSKEERERRAKSILADLGSRTKAGGQGPPTQSAPTQSAKASAHGPSPR